MERHRSLFIHLSCAPSSATDATNIDSNLPDCTHVKIALGCF